MSLFSVRITTREVLYSLSSSLQMRFVTLSSHVTQQLSRDYINQRETTTVCIPKCVFAFSLFLQDLANPVSLQIPIICGSKERFVFLLTFTLSSSSANHLHKLWPFCFVTKKIPKSYLFSVFPRDFNSTVLENQHPTK